MRKLLAVLLFIPSAVCTAQTGGAIIARIPLNDGAQPRCIDPAHDKIWLTLRRLVTTRTESWFTRSTSVAIVIEAQVKTSPAQAQTVKFPLMTEATFGDAPNGQVSLPIEYNIVSGLLLHAPNSTYYDGMGIDITLLPRSTKNKWGTALRTLDEVTKGLPIPASPLTQAASYLMDFANNAVDKDIADQPKDDKVKSAALALTFDPDAKCQGDFETTGTVAIIQREGVTGPNLIPVDKTKDYCFASELRPVFLVKAASRDPAFACSSAHYDSLYREISNNYVGFFINAVAASGTAGAMTAAVKRDQEASRRRCIANDVAATKCLS